mgnify:CR=1 FL=1
MFDVPFLKWIDYALWIIALLIVITILNRSRQALKEINETSSVSI